jgi:hypothetical protein
MSAEALASGLMRNKLGVLSWAKQFAHPSKFLNFFENFDGTNSSFRRKQFF